MMLVGIVGKPSTGKSTFFKAATLAEVEVASYPFTTIKPNHSAGFIKTPCAEKPLNVKCNPRFGYCIDGTRFVPIDMIDVAGLVPGAHEGKGMGNVFLNDLNQADVLIHIIDISGKTNEKGESTENYDPANDVTFLEEELDYWYLEILKKGWAKFSRTLEHKNNEIEQELAEQLSVFNVKPTMIRESLDKLSLDVENISKWTEEELFSLAKYIREKTKPMIIAANKIDASGAKENYDKLVEKFPNITIIPCSADSELALREAAKKELVDYIPGEDHFEIKGEMNDKQKQAMEFIKTNILDVYGTTGVQKILDFVVLDLLKYMPIFPGGLNNLTDKDGNTLPDCFLLPPDSTALDFAYRLHTDFGKNFIRAIDVKTKRTIGKEHELKPGDVIVIIADK